MGIDFSKKEEAMTNAWYAEVGIEAGPGEYEISDDPAARQQPQWIPTPPYVVRLTEEAARGAGLLTQWDVWRKPLPAKDESVRFDVYYDWDSPKWAWDGTARRHRPVTQLVGGTNAASCGVLAMHRQWEGDLPPLLVGGLRLNQSLHMTS